MSKKLIAVAAAAALALTGLVGVSPASANVSFTVVDLAGAGTSASPYTHSAPKANELLNDGTTDGATTNTAVRYVVTSAAATTVTVTSTGGVKLLDAQTTSTNKYDTASGVTSLSLPTGGGTTVTFWAFSTSIAPGTVVISDRGNVSTTHVAMAKTDGNLDPYNLSVSAPATGTNGTAVTLSAVVTDIFGNVIDSTNEGGFVKATDLDVVIIGGATLAAGGFTYSTVRKAWEAKVNLPSSGGVQAIGVTLQDNNTAISSAAAAGFAAPITSGFVTINSQDQAALIATLQGQVAALTAQLAESRPIATSVTKKRYNTLARKWNAANPGARVALKK